MDQVPADKRYQLRFTNAFNRREAKKRLGENIFSAVAKSNASADDGVPEMKGSGQPLYAEVDMAIAENPSAQSSTVGNSFEGLFDGWENPMEARSCLDQLHVANTNLVESTLTTPHAVASLLTAGQQDAAGVPPTAEPKEYVDKGCQCLSLTTAAASILGDGFLRLHGKVYKPATFADVTNESSQAVKMATANRFEPLADSS